MSMYQLVRRCGHPGDEQGFALITVMLSMLAMMALATAIVAYGIGSQFTSHHDENWNAALGAAEAGVNDYLHRINSNQNYATTYGNWPGAVPAQTPDPSNKAFTQFVNVPGSSTSQYRYWVNSQSNVSSLGKSGFVELTVTGKVGNAARTLDVRLRVSTYLDFLYYTDLEISDPQLVGGQPANCVEPHHAYTQGGVVGYNPTPSNNGGGCSIITFIGNASRQDTINGPLHTNDLLRVCGSPKFLGKATTSYPGYTPTATTPVKAGQSLWYGSTAAGCTNAPQFPANTDTSNLDYSDPIPPLPSNAALKTYTGGSTGGCLYTGPTSITFNSDGGWTVSSPTTSSPSPGCPANGANDVKPGAAFNGVVYVDTFTPGNPNPCKNKTGNLLGYPKNGDTQTYSCTAGDVFLSGNLKGQVTVGAANDITVVGNLLYHDKTPGVMSYQGNDLLGLIANRFIAVYHPVNSSGNEVSGSLLNPEIDAAMLSVQHSFYVPQWGSGDPSKTGTLTVFGAIAQEYRGAVGTFSGASINSGYIKNYNYDNRLKYLEPPYFLNPTATVFQQSTWSEESPKLTDPR
ncbi:MAG TPA: hypothetical protein VIC35_03440 [Acidimicrobiia bacterium]|jgi:Tfp pilus assembly protein PilX